MVVQADRDDWAGIHKEHGVTRLLGAVVGERDRHPGHPEDPLVPLSACFNIGHSRRKVMEAGNGRRRGGLGQGRLLYQRHTQHAVDDHTLAPDRLWPASNPRSGRLCAWPGWRIHPDGYRASAMKAPRLETGP